MRKIMKWSCFILLQLYVSQLSAQTFTSVPAINRSNLVSVPTTPEAAKFQQYTDVPVNISSGIPDIKVPVFAFQLKDFNWSIDLSYHAGGNKVADLAGYTGLGWSLNYGGIISAKMVGQFDLLVGNASNNLRRDLDVFASGQSGAPAQCTYANQSDIAIAELASDGFNTNYLPDVYYLNTNNFNTKFFFNADNELSTMPASDIRINYTVSLGSSESNIQWTVTDENGNKYYFEKMGSNSVNMGMCGGSPTSPTFIYYLTKIITYHGEILTFNYTNLDYTYQTTDNEVKYVKQSYPNTSPCNTWGTGPAGEGTLPLDRTCPVYASSHERLIQSIVSSNGTSVTFTYSSRNDLPAGKKLDKIEVFNNATGTNVLKKVILLNYNYFGSGSNPDDIRLKLENVSYKAVDADKYFQYAFEYNPILLPNRLSKGMDLGGFYNGSFNTSLIPPAANRNSSLDHTKACVLEKIIYPTGGYSTYNYELNDLVGGLRVKSTESFDKVTDKTIKKSYNYETPYMSGYQFWEDYVSFFMYKQGDDNFSQLINCNAIKYSSQASDGYMYGDGGICYGKVTEYLGANGTNGKVEYFFSASDDLMIQFDLAYPGNPMKKKITYSYNPATTSYDIKLIEEYKYKIIKDDVAGYYANSSYPREQRTWGTPVTYVHDELSSSSFTDSYCVPKLFFAGRLRLLSAPLILEREIKTQYENGQITIDTADYFYGTNYEKLKPVKISYRNSKGQFTTHKLYYVNHLPNFSNYPVTNAEITAYTDLLASNRITMIGSEKEVNNTITAKKLTTYTSGLPYRELLFENGNVLSSEVKAAQYAGFNIAQLEDSRNPVKSFLWDYSSNYLVAEVNGAAVATIAYTSVEANGWGGWTMNPGSVIINNYPGITGKNTISGGVQKVVPAGDYVVSFWSIANSWLNGQLVTQTPVKIIGPWRYYEITLTNASSINVAGDNIDEIRLYPKGAQMVTYTYDPLIGITSQCDANSRLTYYQYDGFGRLLRIRDEEKNIIKQFDYQYQATVPNGAVWQTNGVTRCKPCALNQAYSSYILQRQEINTNPNIIVEPRWVDVGPGSSCDQPDWVNTSTPVRCVTTNDGSNTGEQEQEQRDMNPCSLTANQTRWVVIGTDLETCPLPTYTCDYSNCEYQGPGFACINNNCEFGMKVYFLSTPAGSGLWTCYYRYEWSDGSWSDEYTETSSFDCMNP